ARRARHRAYRGDRPRHLSLDLLSRSAGAADRAGLLQIRAAGRYDPQPGLVRSSSPAGGRRGVQYQGVAPGRCDRAVGQANAGLALGRSRGPTRLPAESGRPMMQPSAKITGARFIAETLKGYGVTHIFYVDAILRKTMVELEELGIRRVITHSEKAAAYMADGYARVSHRAGVCMAQSVGAAKLGSGLQDAYLGLSPVVALTWTMT